MNGVTEIVSAEGNVPALGAWAALFRGRAAASFGLCGNSRKTDAASSAPPKDQLGSHIDRHRAAAAFALFIGVCTTLGAQGSARPVFRGSAALADTRQAVSFGERPSGSAANRRLREWIAAELKPTGAQVFFDTFSGATPNGPVAMANVIAKFPGASGRAVAVSGHFDTKNISGVHFVGANDAGSSTGFLVEFARAVAKSKHSDDIFVIFFDGEEAVGQWTDRDSLYGSRHLAAKWLADGTISHVKALINVDMIGDKDLDIMDDGNSAAMLRAMVHKAVMKLGYGKYFRTDANAIEDDHRPFAELGVSVLDLIDFDYGPNQAYWHTAKDTMDRLSAQSLQIVGDVVLELVKELDGKD